MVVHNPSDMECRVGFESANKFHKSKGCFGKGLVAVPVKIKTIIGIQRVFYCLFKIIKRSPFQHILDGKSLRFLMDCRY